MGKFSGLLVLTDLDGTLFRSDKTISEENRLAIDYFKSEGGLFTFITGRLPYYSRAAYDAVKPNAPFGCINGGGVYDGEAGRYIWSCSLSPEAIELVECIDEGFPEVGIQIVCHHKTYFAKDNEVGVKFRQLTGLPNLTCDYRSLDEPIAKVIFESDSEDEMQRIARTLKEHPLSSSFELIRSERTLFEILPKGVNKGNAVRRLAEHLGIPIERTVAIGDYDNDVGMLRAAGIGIAVANASPSALAAADLVTVTNEQHAVARIIYDIRDGLIRLPGEA